MKASGGEHTFLTEGSRLEEVRSGVADLRLVSPHFTLSLAPQLATLRHSGDLLSASEMEYPAVAGLPALKRELSEAYGVPEEWIVVTNGASEAIFLAAAALSAVVDGFAVPLPSFPAYRPLIAGLLGRRLFNYDALNVTHLLGLFGRASVALINSPHNPTGACLSAADLGAIARTADRHGVATIWDEAYQSFGPGGDVAPTALQLSTWPTSNSVVVRTLSKSLGLPGLRVGAAISPNARLRNELVRLKTHLSMGVSIASQRLALVALRSTQGLPELLGKAASRNLEILGKALEAACLRHTIPQAGVYIFVNDDRLGDKPEDASRALLDAGVAGVPGSMFGAAGPCVRLCCAVPEETLARASVALASLSP